METHYERNKELYMQRAKESLARRIAWVISLKDAPCVDCGGKFHHSAMQFDHLPGSDKVNKISYLMKRAGREKILAEIAKCELVCANCHAVRTWERANEAL